MAKITSQDKHGSVGPSTFQSTRYGLVERARVCPLDPKTPRQLDHRAIVLAVARQWRHLPEEARPGWMALAGQLRGHLTGPQVHFKVNVVLAKCGLPIREQAPPVPVFGPLTCGGLLVNATPQVKLLQVSHPGGADWWVVEACAPVHRGIQYMSNRFRQLTVVPGVVGAAVDLDLTAAYVARFLAPEADERVCVRLTPHDERLQGGAGAGGRDCGRRRGGRGLKAEGRKPRVEGHNPKAEAEDACRAASGARPLGRFTLQA